MQARREIIWQASGGYDKLSKKEKANRLTSVVAITGYNRDYASRLLSLQGKNVYVKGSSGRTYKLVADVRKTKKRPNGKKKYDEEVLKALIWIIMDRPCGKRLAPCMSWLVPKLEVFGEIEVSSCEVERKVTFCLGY